MISASDVKKRVLFLVDKSGFGGVQTIAGTLIEHGVSSSVDMRFFFLRNINDRFKMADIDKPCVSYSKATRRYSLRPFFEVLGLIREHPVDIVHLNGNKSVILGVVLKVLFFPHLKIVAHEHGGVFDYTSWYPLFLKLSRRWIDRFVTISDFRKQFLVRRSDVAPDRVCVLDNFVDPERLGLPERHVAGQCGRGNGNFVIGYVGGLSRIKGCDVLINAFALVRESIPNARLVVAGDGPDRRELEALAERLNFRGQIEFLGFIEKPGTAYASFDVMVIPSRSEEGPICLYEAWLAGLPVVASNARVLNERIRDGETGILFESENAEHLAGKILLVYENRGIASRIKAGGMQEAQMHSVDRYRSSLCDLYASL